MTRWLVVAGLILAAALVLESGLLAYSMYALLALLLISRGLAAGKLDHLAASRDGLGISREVGGTVRMRVSVTNTSSAPIPWILLEDLVAREAIDPRKGSLKVKGRRVRLAMMAPKGTITLEYTIECLRRGYFQIGPLVVENGDLFGLYRKFRVMAPPAFLLVLPKVVPLAGYDIASRRPIGEIRLTHRLFEDVTRMAGIREYAPGDPLNRVHWKATARSGTLQCRVFEPSCLAGATIVLDFHADGYPAQGEPARSDLAVTAAASLVGALCELRQQVGLVTNGRDARDRILSEGYVLEPTKRSDTAGANFIAKTSDRLAPQVLPVRRSDDQLDRARELLARLEKTDGLPLEQLLAAGRDRIPRDTTILALLPRVSMEAAAALGDMRRQGYAVGVILIMMESGELALSLARLAAERIHDVRHLESESRLPELCLNQVDRSAPYGLVAE
ncbi:MAG: DUF58 domain-containing protein [Planctomycetes bacterium]|nr:DUF58 domain-containing protein [Planctomycetota bacterium]